jgi:hypothetical protein
MKIKDREKIKEKENRITKTIFFNECREVFKKDRDSNKDVKELKGSKTDRSDFDNIFQVLFNRFKVIKDDKVDYENTKIKVKSQAPNKDSTTKALKIEKKTDKNLNSIDSRTKTNKFDGYQSRGSLYNLERKHQRIEIPCKRNIREGIQIRTSCFV